MFNQTFNTSDRTLQYIVLEYLRGERDQSLVSGDIIHWAEEKLMEGSDSVYICYLAAYTYAEAVEKKTAFWLHFTKALQELNLTIPNLSVPEARTQYACAVCRDLLAGLYEKREALEILYEIWLEDRYDKPENQIQGNYFNIWMYISDSLSVMADGYEALPPCKGLTPDNYDQYFRTTAQEFIDRYSQAEL